MNMNDDVVGLNVEANDAYEQLRSREREGVPLMPSSNYIVDTQDGITEATRMTCINRMVFIANRHSIPPITLFSAASYFDRYFSVRDWLGPLYYDKLVAASLVIAWKLEGREDSAEIILPDEISRLRGWFIEDHLRRHNELKSPTAATFLSGYVFLLSQNLQLEILCYYIAELSLVDYACLKFLPSLVAASAVFLSRFTLQSDQRPWSADLQQYSGYRAADLKECVLRIHDLQLGRRKDYTFFIKHKYLQPKFQRVAALISLPQIPEAFFQD